MIALDLNKSSQLNHLSDDAEFAEDLAIRYADTNTGPGSRHFEGMAAYQRTRDGCMTSLFLSVAMSHAVTEQAVRRSLGRRRMSFDLATMLSFALVFGLGVNRVIRAIVRTHLPNNGWIGTVVLLAFMAITASLAFLMIGEQWCATAEGLRLGTGHLSYRGGRIPWIRYRTAVFWSGVMIVGIISAIQCHRARAIGDRPQRTESFLS